MSVPRTAVSAFDAHDAPSPAQISTCVHCGFCLPTCPTFVLWGEEMDSPRGRIYLMKSLTEGRVDLSPAVVGHFDSCLGCMACVTACPSGVQYGPLIEKTRAQVERRFDRPWAERLFRDVLFAVLPYPARLKVLLAPLALFGPGLRSFAESRLGRKLPARIGALLRLAPPVTVAALRSDTAELTPATGDRRASVAMLTGCVQRVAFKHVNDATARVLAAEGCDVHAPATQGCCGALALHAGQIDLARDLARQAIASLGDAKHERIVVNAAGCGSAMKEYGELLADDAGWAQRAKAFSARVKDVSEVLVELGPARAPRSPIKARVAYHDACHLAHAQGVRSAPRALLATIPGIELMTPAESDICCGSAGIYNIVQPKPAAELGARKAANLDALAPDIVATGNPGCTLQIAAAARARGAKWDVVHPIELLDRAIQGSSGL
jgi:glycolate oxidase iron-sulfur subunit